MNCGICGDISSSFSALLTLQHAPYYTTVGKRNYFTGYRILLHELPVVAVLFTQSIQ